MQKNLLLTLAALASAFCSSCATPSAGPAPSAAEVSYDTKVFNPATGGWSYERHTNAVKDASVRAPSDEASVRRIERPVERSAAKPIDGGPALLPPRSVAIPTATPAVPPTPAMSVAAAPQIPPHPATAGGLANAPAATRPVVSTSATAPAVSAPASPPSVATALADYRLGAGDEVKVTVFGQPDLSGQYRVGARGELAYPLIGDVAAEGLTVTELARGLTERLRGGYLLRPNVTVEIVTYRPFYILGEVGRPGTYPYTAGLTALKAIATAGGFTYRANMRVIYIKREREPVEEKLPMSGAVAILPGDTLRVPERVF